MKTVCCSSRRPKFDSLHPCQEAHKHPSSPRRSNALFWTPQAFELQCTYPLTTTHMIQKIFRKLKETLTQFPVIWWSRQTCSMYVPERTSLEPTCMGFHVWFLSPSGRSCYSFSWQPTDFINKQTKRAWRHTWDSREKKRAHPPCHGRTTHLKPVLYYKSLNFLNLIGLFKT